jgi:hypothetical protein
MIFVAIAGFAGTQQPPAPPIVPGKFFTGAKPTPFAEIAKSIKAGKAGIHKPVGAPSQVIHIPKRLSYWGNNQYGVCVTSESVFSMADYSTYLGIEQIFVTDATTIAWARAHGWLNGAWLLEVIEAMQSEGIKDEKGILRKAGKAMAVNYGDEESLKSAIAIGPVSIAIASNALPSGAGNNSGWYSFGNKNQRSTDHCVSLSGYGPCSELFKALGVSMPANAPANGYLLFTWSTIGVVDHAWIMGTCEEAWVRDPTVVGLTPLPPTPGNVTVAIPNVSGGVNVPVKFSPTASGGVSPYIFLFDYGDGTQDAAGTHTYKTGGLWPVKVTAVDSKGSLGTGTCSASIGIDPPVPPPPGPGGAGTITWTVNGVTSQYELFPIGTRQKILDAIGPMTP